jgi:hypothetical protein
MEEELKKQGIAYSLEVFEVEHGQPFRSAEDAARFFTFYADTPYSVQQARAYLTETGDDVLPLYYAQKRSLGMIVFDAGKACAG